MTPLELVSIIKIILLSLKDLPFLLNRSKSTVSTALSQAEGTPIETVLEKLAVALKQAQHVVGHNINFDRNIMGAEFLLIDGNDPLVSFSLIDTCTEETAALCELPGGRRKI